jgi:hypothetical protein
MKITSLKLLLAAALGVLASPALTLADTATIDLSNSALKSGHSEHRAADIDLPASFSYDYAIGGTCHGTGNLGPFIPSGTSLHDALATLGQDTDFLNGTVYNSTDKLPFTVVSKSVKGTETVDSPFGPLKFLLKAKIVVKFDKDGRAGFALTGVSATLNGQPDTKDGIVIDTGSCTVTPTVAPSSSAQPDEISFVPPNFGFGDNAYSPDGSNFTTSAQVGKGKAHTFMLLVQNDGPEADTFTITGPAADAGFKVQYFDGKTDITSQVTEAGYALPELDSAAAHLIKVKLTAKTAKAGDSESIVVKATSGINSSVDAMTLEITVKTPGGK